MDKYQQAAFALYARDFYSAESADDSAGTISGSDPELTKDTDDDFWTYDRKLIASFAEVDDRVSALRAWRSDVASRNSWSAWVVFTDKQLIALANANPSTLDELSKVSGISAEKVSRYGQDILNVLGERIPTYSV